MKTKLLLAIGFLIISIATWGQTTNTVSDNEIEQYVKIKGKIKAMSDKIDNADKEKIADLIIRKTIVVHTTESKDGKDIDKEESKNIQDIHIVINDGVIRNIEVKVEGLPEKFTNLKCPIGLTPRRFEKNRDALNYVGSHGKIYIYLQNLLELNNWEQYIPSDIVIDYPKKDKDSIALYRNNGINTVFDIRLYSDALALFGQEKNGLAQTDMRFKQTIHRSNFYNLPIYAFQYFNINFNYAKFDSKDEYINPTSFSNADLLRKRFVSGEVALNIINGYVGYKSLNKFYLDAGAGVGLNKLAKSNDSISITHTNIFLEAGTNFKFASNGGVNLNVRAIKLFSPSTGVYDDQLLHTTYFNYMKYGAEIYWNPKDSEANRLFARINYIEPTSSMYKKDGFFQVQVGYSLLLSELINKK